MIKTTIKTLLLTVVMISPQVVISANEPTTKPPAQPMAIPVGSQSMELRQSRTLPEYGQTMNAVEKLLGSPQKTDSIGKPVITRWFYPQQNLTVYFEGKHVLRAVLENMP